ncbi:MAG: 4-hydroxyphenylpyruvate dioxygenase [Bacteroidetes bacterium]|nr:4-hydroxyphenylpyruvate dioxygenase [Bacteroidota bacterium]
MSTITSPASSEVATESDFLPISGTDYIEFYVGNAKQAAHFYCSAFGFQIVAYAGLETGNRNKTSYVLQQGKIRIVLSTSMDPDSEIAKHVKLHGDGVKDLALWVDDATSAYNETMKRGAVSVMEPITTSDEFGSVTRAAIRTYGETIHTFVERKDYTGVFMPGYTAVKRSASAPKDVGLQYVDHCVGNVYLGEMNECVDFYADVMGFRNLKSFDDSDISTEYTALMSKVMANGNDRIKFPINEPAIGRKKSQIEEYLDFYRGQGVQHIAMATNNIIETVSALKSRGVEFLYVPDTYYDSILDRVGTIDEDLAPLRELGILVDRDEEGYLLQIFTKPVQDRPTVFYEIIQRKGARSFGKGNFKALFESIEREQALRGNL